MDMLSPLTPCGDVQVAQNIETTNNSDIKYDPNESIADLLPVDPASHVSTSGKLAFILGTCSTHIADDTVRLTHLSRLGCPPMSKPHIGPFILLMWPNNVNVWFEDLFIRYNLSHNTFDVL